MKKYTLILLFLLFYSFSLAQDPNGPDRVWVEAVNTIVPASGGNVVFKVMCMTDNTGAGNDIVGWGISLYINNSNPSASPVLDKP